MTRYHVYASDNDDGKDGGAYEHVKTFEIKVNMLDRVSQLLDEGKAVQILPQEYDDA